MRDRRLHAGSFGLLCACLIIAPCAALAQENGTAPKSTAPGADSTARSATPAAGSDATAAAPGVAPGDAPSAAPARGAPAKGTDDLEPAVDTSDNAARAQAESGAQSESAHGAKQGETGAKPAQNGAKQAKNGRGSGNAIDHLELGTTDITGNRELPKVMYIVPWKRADLGDLTGKPLNSLIDQTLEPVDRNVFERSNRYYGAVTAGASTAGAPNTGAPNTGAPNVGAPHAGAPQAGAPNAGAPQDAHRTPGAGSGSAARDER